MTNRLRNVLLASTALSFLFCGAAQAAEPNTAEAIKALQAQVDALQKQLGQIQAKESVASAKAAAPATSEAGKKEILPGVTFKFGGYLETAAVWRENNQTAETTSSINTGVPFANNRNSTHDEFRGTAQGTRFNFLAQGKPSKDMAVAAFVETDFMGAALTSNEVKSSSYVPRLRHAYATVNSEDLGGFVMVGQAFSLTTPFKSGLAPRQEVGVATIDGTGPAGFIYTRSPSVRVVKDFAENKMHFGLALEGAEASTGGAITTPTGVTLVNAGTGALGSNSYSMDYAPDVIAKLAYDSPIGHYEIYGMSRFFRDVVGTTEFSRNYAVGFSGGASAFVSLVPKKLELAANFAGGRGIGRYSSANMPDLAFTPSGDIKPLTQLTGLVGLIGHPTPSLDVYLYAGAEKVMRQNSETNIPGSAVQYYGYGSSSADHSDCYGGGTDCYAQSEMVWQITPGVWSQIYKGDYGWMKLGAQYSYTRRNAFSGVDNKTPHADENIVMVSFRYSPF